MLSLGFDLRLIGDASHCGLQAKKWLVGWLVEAGCDALSAHVLLTLTKYACEANGNLGTLELLSLVSSTSNQVPTYPMTRTKVLSYFGWQALLGQLLHSMYIHSIVGFGEDIGG